MPKLIIINGASGAGKTFLLEKITNPAHSDMVAIKKYTTRSPRDDNEKIEAHDLIFSQSVDYIKSLTYKYPFKDEWYGIDEKDITNAPNKGKYPCVILRDYPTITTLRAKYDENSLAYYIQGVYSGNDLKQLLLKQGRSENEADSAVARNQENFDQYYTHLTKDFFEDKNLFDGIIINYYNETFIGQFNYYLKRDKKNNAKEEK